MPDKSAYEETDRDELIKRLEAAERVCILYGYTESRYKTDREKAIYEWWLDWSEIVGMEFIDLTRHPEFHDQLIFMRARDFDNKRARIQAAAMAAEQERKRKK
jgi:hypothetical protein